MYRYLVCSDIHGNISNFEYALREASAEGVDGVIVAGDTEMSTGKLEEMVEAIGAKLYLVKGNCDYSNAAGLRDMITFELPHGKTCLLTHGHRYHVKSDLYTLAAVADNLKADLVIYGHTHVYDDMSMGKVRLINPGALCGGYYSQASYILMTVYDKGIDILKRTIL